MNAKLKPVFIGLWLLLPLAVEAGSCVSHGSTWKSYSNPQLGVTFCHPAKLIVQIQDENIYVRKCQTSPLKPTTPRKNNVDLVLNGKRLSDPNDYIAHFRIGRGDFTAANSKEIIFIDDKSTIRAGIGRFNNPKARITKANGWSGYKTEIICSTSDPKTGFHAAGGQCLWVVGSDGQRNFVLDTQGNPADIPISWKIAKSLRFISAS